VTIVALVVGVLTSTAFAAAPAGAAERAVSPLTTATTGWRTTTFSTTLTSAASPDAQAQVIITCGGTVSTPVVVAAPGQTVQGVRTEVQAWCDAPVDRIEVTARLFRNGSLVAERFNDPVPGTSSDSAFAVTNCPGVAATYQGFGRARFLKEGFANSPLVLEGYSPPVNIAC
jgi:hypothetical protein